MYRFPNLEPVCCSMSGSNCCFLTCIQISQEAGKMVWYSHLLKNFPEFVVVHRVKAFGLVNKAEVDAFMELFSFFNDPMNVGNLISGSFSSSKPNLFFWKFLVHILLKPYPKWTWPSDNSLVATCKSDRTLSFSRSEQQWFTSGFC